MVRRIPIAFIGLMIATHSPAEGAVSLSASAVGVQIGGEITFTATTDETDTVVKVTFSYQGTGDTDEVTTPPYQVTKSMDWATMEDLTVTATFDFENISDQSDTVDVDVVDITLIAPTQPFRGTTVAFVARTDPTGLSVSSWDWEYDTALLNNSTTDESDSDDLSTWGGRIVISGTVSVDATLLTVACTQSLEISVQNRAGVGWNTPINCVEDNEPLWGAPLFGYNEPLGQIRDEDSDVHHIIVPQTSTGDWSDGVTVAQVPSGPNAGLWYVVSECLVIDQETVINRYMKSGGPPPEPGATTFFAYNDAGCISGDMADFVTAVEHHEYRGTPPVSESLEGHFGRMEYHLENGPGHPGVAVEALVDTSSAALLDEINDTVGFIETSIDGFTTDGSWSDAGPNWGGDGALGSGKHTRYDVIAGQYYSGCTFGPDHF